MKFSVETITPRRAKEILGAHLKVAAQRKVMPGLVDDYARMMTAGQWGLTHQGICIADNNELTDGQHRLLAIIQSGMSIRCVVVRGLPAVTKSGLPMIDLVDRGKGRTVGQQLQLRHGYVSGNLIAAAADAVLLASCRAIGVQPGRQSVGNALAVLSLFGTEIRHCAENRSSLPRLGIGGIVGAFAFAMRSHAEVIKPAYSSFVTGEHLSKSDPMLTLRNYFQGDSSAKIGNPKLSTIRATLQACQKCVLQESLGAIKSQTEGGVNFFIDGQKQAINKLLVACGYNSDGQVGR
jgi:hypothetical protein